MIVGVAVCPGAPFLVEGIAPAVARAVPDLLTACADAVDRLPPADHTVVIGSWPIESGQIESGPLTPPDGPGFAWNPTWRTFPPGTAVRTSVTRHDLAEPGILRLPGGGGPADGEVLGIGPDVVAGTTPPTPSVATLVGAHLLRTARHPRPTSAVEVYVPGNAALGAALPPELGPDGPDWVTLLVIADGAARHGDNAPGRRDDRSAVFDAAVARALAAGDPVALRDACRNPELPADAVMASIGPLALLAELTGAAPPDAADLLYSAAPFGVGYFVASWRWTRV